MPEVTIPTDASGGLIGGGAASGNPMISQLLELVREVRLLIENPIISNRFNKASHPQGVGGGTINEYTSPPPLPLKKEKSPSNKEIDKDMVADYLSTPEGRETLKNGIHQLINTVGDVQLTELLTLIEATEKKGGGIDSEKKATKTTKKSGNSRKHANKRNKQSKSNKRTSKTTN